MRYGLRWSGGSVGNESSAAVKTAAISSED